jgi:branched-chain amino acid transport system permease protein
MRDRQAEIYDRFDAKTRTNVLGLVNDEMIAEHAANPRGPHGMALQRVLRYMRRAPINSKYVIVAVQPWKLYEIATMTPVEGAPTRLIPRIIDGPSYPTETSAMHGVFLRRLEDLGWPGHEPTTDEEPAE